MPEERDLDDLSSRELHDLAMRRARHHLDIGFMWDLIREIPAARAAAGHEDESDLDVTKASALIGDIIDSGSADEADELRPIYLDYLRKHGVKP